jgi:hypothetical protein
MFQRRVTSCEELNQSESVSGSYFTSFHTLSLHSKRLFPFNGTLLNQQNTLIIINITKILISSAALLLTFSWSRKRYY